MDLQGLGNSLIAEDTRLVNHIVGEVKSQGIFDKFRKECIADVDTKPAYQNLRTRVESSVNTFLNKQIWRTDLNKTQLRETLRKHIHDAPYLEVGVERIVDQVVNPKIYSVFMPQIEDVVYKYLGIEKPKSQKNGTCDLKDLLPKDLDPISPESDRNSLKDTFESMDEITNDAINDDEQKPSCSIVNKKSLNIEDPEIKEEFVRKDESLVKDEFEKETEFVKKEKIERKEEYVQKEEIERNEECVQKEEIKRKEEYVQKEELAKQEEPKMKEEINIENNIEEAYLEEATSPVKATLKCSLKSDEANKTEDDEEPSPAFEPLDIMNESNDSQLSGFSELTSHRSHSPDFMAEFSRDNFDCSNQDSQLSKVSSGSRLSIVTDFGSSNHASTPAPDSKEDSKGAKDNFKSIKDFDLSKDKFNFDVIKNKDRENSKISCSSKESSRDASEYKDNRSKDESKLKSLRDTYDSKSGRDKDRDSKRHHHNKSDKYLYIKSKDKNKSQESLNSNKSQESKSKAMDKKDDSSNKAKDLKDLYKEKIRELLEKKELTEKEKQSKDNKDSFKISKDKKELSSASWKKDDNRRSHKSSSSSSSRSSSYHKRSKESRARSSSRKCDDRRHSSGKSSSRSSRSSSKQSSKLNSHSRDRDSSSSRKRRDDKKSSTDNHSSQRKNANDRRSSDRDGSSGSSSKYSYKTPNNLSTSRLGPPDNNKDHSSGEAPDNVHDSLQTTSLNSEPKRLDPGSAEICLPLKKRPLQSDESSSGESPEKKPKLQERKIVKKKNLRDVFKNDGDVTSVPDEERVQIIEITEEDCEQPYSDREEPVLSLEDTKNIIFNAEPVVNPIVNTVQSKLSEMEKSIRDSLSEMMSDHGVTESDHALTTNKLLPVIDSTSSLIETLTDDSLEASLMDSSNIIIPEKIKHMAECKDKEDIETVEKYLKEHEIQNENEVKKEITGEILQIKSESKEGCNSSELEQMNEYLKASAEVKDHSIEGKIEKTYENVEIIVDKDMGNKKLDQKETIIEVSTVNVEKNTADSSKVMEDKETIKDIVEQTDISKNGIENVTKKDMNEPVNTMLKCVFTENFKVEKNVAVNTQKVFTKTELVEKPIEDYVKIPKPDVNKDGDILHMTTEVTKDSLDFTEIKTATNLYQDEESIDNNTSDEFNEDKLVIDEDIDLKDHEDNYKLIDSKVSNYKENDTNETLLESRAKSINDLKNDDMSIVIDSEKLSEILNTKIDKNKLEENVFESEDKLQEKANVEIVDKLQAEISENYKITKKLIQSNCEDKINEASIVVEKQIVCSEDLKINFDDNTKILKLTEDDNKKDQEKDLIICKEEKNVEIKSLPARKGLKNTGICIKERKQVPSTKSPVPENSSSMPVIISGRIKTVVSPVEEDCRYFENDNYDKYLRFKQFLDKLESNPSQISVNTSKRESKTIISAKADTIISTQSMLKRKFTLSPLSDILITNSNELESAIKNVINEELSEKPAVIKKRKPGRAKKISSSTMQVPVLQQQVELRIEQQQQQQPQQSEMQQAPTTLANGENIVFPVNVDNDGEKKDEKGRNRSRQHYSSEDLYKPRPLFSSSSRRNRRFNNQT